MRSKLKGLVGIVLLGSILHSGPPMMSDDPFTPDLHTFEINFASEIEKGDDLKVVAPIIDVNYGIYPHTQLTLESGYASSRHHYRSDGLEVAVKYHFYRGEILNVALYPKYLFYPINTPFDEGSSYEFQIPISLQFSENLEWVTSLSYFYPQQESTHYEVGSYLAYQQKNHTYFLETYLEENPTDNSLGTFFNLGYLYEYQENLAIMGSLGSESVDSKKEANLAYIGVQLIF